MKQNITLLNEKAGRALSPARFRETNQLQESEELLRSMLVSLSRLSTVSDLPFENRLEAMRTSIKDGLSTMQLQPLFKEINQYMNNQQVQASFDNRNQVAGSIHGLSALLLEKLDGISSPASFVEQLEPARELLRLDVDKRDSQSFEIALVAFFDEWQHFTAGLHLENQGLQEFMQELTEELHNVRQCIHPGQELQHELNDARQQVDASLGSVESELDSSGISQQGLKDIRQLFITRIRNIRQSVESFKAKEDQRNRQAEEQIARLNQQLQQMQQKTESLERRLKEKDRQYLTDSLTGVPNRIAYEERIQEECERYIRNNTPVCLLVLDVDNFKSINDTYGHAAGDKVLSAIAEAIQQNIRSIDFVARFGGEEFVVVMNGVNLENGMKAAEKLRKKIEMAHFIVKNVRLPVTFSGGIAEFREYDSPASLFERADNALYIAKECGKNRIESE